MHELRELLARKEEIRAAKAPGRTAERIKQMAEFANLFQRAMDSSPHFLTSSSLTEAQFSAGSTAAALQHQTCVVKLMAEKSLSELEAASGSADAESSDFQAAMSNHRAEEPMCTWIDNPCLLQGPKHVAWRLCRDENLSEEQVNAVALVVLPLQKAFDARPNKSSHLIPTRWQEGYVRVVFVGSGGCGKSLLINKVFTPLLQAYFGPKGLLKQAPSNKAARLIGGRTLHVTSALTATQSLRTANLKPSDTALKKLQILNIPAGAQLFDEFSQIPAALFHGVSLRACYARRHAYQLDLNSYASSPGLFGHIPVLLLFGDHLQLPPVPQSTSFFASLDGTSSEHKAGSAMFGNIEDIFCFEKARRFRDQNLIAILTAMRQPEGQALTDQQWHALQATEVDGGTNFNASQFLRETHGWFHVAHTWSLVTMAAFLRAQSEAQHDQKRLMYIPACDAPKKVCSKNLYREMLQVYHIHTTKKNPSVCILYLGMRVRFTTSVLPPFAVQDATGTVVGMDCLVMTPAGLPPLRETSCCAACLFAST